MDTWQMLMFEVIGASVGLMTYVKGMNPTNTVGENIMVGSLFSFIGSQVGLLAGGMLTAGILTASTRR